MAIAPKGFDVVLWPLPLTEVPFHEVARAHAALESAQSIGKLVLMR